jgi:hypothetical protein
MAVDFHVRRTFLELVLAAGVKRPERGQEAADAGARPA